ncbi:MAG: cytochrome b N-terminal domain-containing protein [Chloroflexota bacterium]
MSESTASTVPTRRRRAWLALDERIGISGLAYPVPAHANGIGYILGGTSFFGFVILALTGIWLTQYYHPTPEAARGSIAYITDIAPFGDIVRGVHFWVANVVMATVLLHMGRVFVTASYKRPREFNWLIGLGLLALTVGLVFTGTVLKWDQEGFEALQHNIEAANLLGAFGFWFSPEFTTSLPILGRLYTAHIMILPALGTILLIVHFLLVKRHGISRLPAVVDAEVQAGTQDRPHEDAVGSTFTAHLVRMTGLGLLILAAAVVLSLLWAPAIGERVDPTIEITKPWWMFLAFYPLEDVFGLASLLWAPTLLFAALALVPFIDRSPWRSPRRRKGIIIAGAIVTMTLVALTVVALISPPAAHIMEAVE